MIYVGIALYGKATWKDLKAESHPRHQGKKRENLCAEFYSPITGKFCEGGKNSYNQILWDKPCLQGSFSWLRQISQTFGIFEAMILCEDGREYWKGGESKNMLSHPQDTCLLWNKWRFIREKSKGETRKISLVLPAPKGKPVNMLMYFSLEFFYIF